MDLHCIRSVHYGNNLHKYLNRTVVRNTNLNLPRHLFEQNSIKQGLLVFRPGSLQLSRLHSHRPQRDTRSGSDIHRTPSARSNPYGPARPHRWATVWLDLTLDLIEPNRRILVPRQLSLLSYITFVTIQSTSRNRSRLIFKIHFHGDHFPRRSLFR